MTMSKRKGPFGARIFDLLGRRDLRSDQEFLPAALAILETPPSPIGVVLLWVICLLMTFALGWSYFGRIDILASAQGKIQPAGRVKTIQPLDTGKVVAVHVENGQHVVAGEVLIELDRVEASADEAASVALLGGARAERARRRTALAAAQARLEGAARAIIWPEGLPEDIRAREERVLRGDLERLRAEIAGVDARLEQKNTEIRGLEDAVAAQRALVETLGQRVAMRRALLARNSTTKSSLIDAMEALQAQEATLVRHKGLLDEARSAADVLHKDRDKAFDGFIAENSQKLAEAERAIDDLEQRSVKARAKTGHMTIASPIAGTVLGLSVTSKNQVVTTSEEMMRIVPDDAGLEVECYVQNKDIGFVRAGQAAVVKIESFPFTRYGSVDARVVRVARDAIPEPDAQSAESSPARALKPLYFGGAQRMQNLVFAVNLTTARATMNVDGAEVPLSSGMSVTVEIKTGKRRILEFLFSPLVETTSRALRER
jgi:hemolysin D